jgi:hypothetical protein
MPILPTSELSAAIERLYKAFKDYPLPESVQACPCCHSVDSDRPLYSGPLRNLRPEDLKEYANDALLVWGGLEDFKHFLPRIFEIVVSVEKFSFADPEIVFSKLDHGNWRTWPRQEQETVQSFLMALWSAALEEPPSDDLRCGPEIEDWLCALAQTGSDLSPYLERWLERALVSPTAAWNLAAMIYRTGMPQARPRGINAYWRGHMHQAEELSKWLHKESVISTVEKAAEIYIDEPFAEELIAAIGIIS